MSNRITTNTTVASILLEKLGIKHSREFLQKTMEELPYAGSLWALHSALKAFGVNNDGLKVEKDELGNLPMPFIAFTAKGMLVVVSSNENSLECFDNNHTLSKYDNYSFCEIWNGEVLVPKSVNNNVEWIAEKHWKEGLNRHLSFYVRCIAVVLLSISLFATAWHHNGQLQFLMHWDTCAYFLLSIVGLLLSILLLREQLYLNSTIALKLCNSLKNGSCRNVLHSSAAKTIGGYSWSEIGFSYFMACLFTQIAIPEGWGILSCLSLSTLPYTLWSLWYQKFKLHQWCALCLMVQAVLVSSACTTICCGIFNIQIVALIAWSVAFVATLATINWLTGCITKGRFSIEWERSYKRLKYSNGILETLAQQELQLLKSPNLESSIVFGNRNAACQITVFSNLHCVTCAKLHEVLSQSNLERCCIRYYFTTLTAEYTQAARKIIACYQQHGEDAAASFLTSWYKATENEEKPLEIYTSLDTANPDVESEIAVHTAWMKAHNLIATPTIFINGAKLPSFYTLEDLIIILP